jgi:hypothetical protein
VAWKSGWIEVRLDESSSVETVNKEGRKEKRVMHRLNNRLYECRFFSRWSSNACVRVGGETR